MSWLGGRSNQPSGGPPPPQPGYSRVPQGAQGLPGGPRPGGAPRAPPRTQGQMPPADRGYDDYEKRPVGRSAPEPANYGRQPTYSARKFQVVESPSPQMALSNCLIINPSEFPDGDHVIVKDRFAVTVKHDNTGKIAPGTVGASAAQRQWIGLSMAGEEIVLAPVDFSSIGNEKYLGSVDLEIGFVKKNLSVAEQFSADEMHHVFSKAYSGVMLSPGQILFWDFHGQTLKASVTGIQILELSSGQQQSSGRGGSGGRFGILMDKTEINFLKAGDSTIKIKQSAKKAPPNAILAPNFKFEDMGIGGLDAEFGNIFRRAFASRVFPLELVEKLGIQHVKGLLLYGPPGTGKTLMARQIGKMLNAREPKVVNGPEILNKYVGASEENVRKLFADAEKEYKEKQDESGLHIIIIDEIDAICKQRGSTGGGTGVGDSVVNQLLSKMDGVEQLNNILLIGMTNRLDMIDDALLRPGRLEVHMEVSLPDEKGRLQILNIHTAKMRANRVMAQNVDLVELAAQTKNFSGAEISGLIKSATSFAFSRHVKVGTMAGISDDLDQLQVNRDDFANALNEVRPAFGVSEEELLQVVQNGIIHFSPNIDRILRDGQLFVEQVKTSTRTPLVTLLLHGPPGSGKTALAATIAQSSSFPFIKFVSPDSMVGFSESQKISAVTKVFQDSYKSPLSVVVVDNLERLLDWVPIGPRFSNGVLQALLVLLSRRPPKGRRLLILATTSNQAMLTDMQMSEAFDSVLRIPPISDLDSLEQVVQDVELFSNPKDLRRAMSILEQRGYGQEGRLNIGVKKLLTMVEMARQEPSEAAERLATAISEFGF